MVTKLYTIDNKIYFFMPQRVKAYKTPIVEDEKNTQNNKDNRDIKYKKKVFYSSDGKRVLFNSNKFIFFLIEPGMEI